MERIYLDYNASTPIAPEVKAVICDLLDREFGNPSALHWASTGAREIIETARCDVANLISCSADEIVFTSGGSESINHALKGVFYANKGDRQQIITTRTEHPAVLSTCAFLERLGAEITYLPVDRTGKLDPGTVREAVSNRTLLISLAHANGEVGTIQDLGDIAEIVHEKGALLHVDAAQSVGKIAVDVGLLGADLLSLAGQKMYAPKGVGALYIKRGVSIGSLVHGAGHQSGRRAGTESALLAAALGEASKLALDLSVMAFVRRLRDHLFARLQETFPGGVHLNGHPDDRLPNTLNVSIPGHIGSDILARTPSLAATTGSACHEGRHEMSPVLAEMGVSEPIGLGAIRFSLGRQTIGDEIAAVPDLVAKAIAH